MEQKTLNEYGLSKEDVCYLHDIVKELRIEKIKEIESKTNPEAWELKIINKWKEEAKNESRRS